MPPVRSQQRCSVLLAQELFIRKKAQVLPFWAIIILAFIDSQSHRLSSPRLLSWAHFLSKYPADSSYTRCLAPTKRDLVRDYTKYCGLLNLCACRQLINSYCGHLGTYVDGKKGNPASISSWKVYAGGRVQKSLLANTNPCLFSRVSWSGAQPPKQKVFDLQIDVATSRLSARRRSLSDA